MLFFAIILAAIGFYLSKYKFGLSQNEVIIATAVFPIISFVVLNLLLTYFGSILKLLVIAGIIALPIIYYLSTSKDREYLRK